MNPGRIRADRFVNAISSGNRAAVRRMNGGGTSDDLLDNGTLAGGAFYFRELL